MQKKEDEERREQGNATPIILRKAVRSMSPGKKIKAQKKEITMGKKRVKCIYFIKIAD